MAKSGTSDLFARILNHPDSLQNDGTGNKETRWWSCKRYGHLLSRRIEQESFKDYLEYFSTAANTIKQNGSQHLITGDGSPRDLFCMSGWVKIPQNKGLQEPQVVTPHLMRHVNPGVKVLVILREPLDRSYSDYYHLHKGDLTARGFDSAVRASIPLLHNCTRTQSLRGCLYNRTLQLKLNAKGQMRLHMGFYSMFIREWLSVFPREQIMIFRFEDFHADVPNYMEKIYKFLDIRRLSQEELANTTNAGHKLVTLAKVGARPMFKETRALLQRLYRPFKEDLANLLNDTRYLWLDKR